MTGSAWNNCESAGRNNPNNDVVVNYEVVVVVGYVGCTAWGGSCCVGSVVMLLGNVCFFGHIYLYLRPP